MLTFRVEEPADYGVVEVNADGVVTSFFEKWADATSCTASAATFLFDERVFRLVSHLPTGLADISQDLLPHLLGRIVAVPATGTVIDIGTPEGLMTARAQARDSNTGLDCDDW